MENGGRGSFGSGSGGVRDGKSAGGRYEAGKAVVMRYTARIIREC